MSARNHLVQQLIRAARGKAHGSNQTSRKRTPLPYFALQRHHFGRIGSCMKDIHAHESDATTQVTVPTPSDFHAHLCNRIRRARDRVILASLYIGVGSDRSQKSIDSSDENVCKEDELLHALNAAASNQNIKKIQILLDANRALRHVLYTTNKSAQSHSTDLRSKKTYSAKSVHHHLKPFLQQSGGNRNNGVFLFPVNDFQLCSILPSPLGEVAGVFHIKAYIIDNELILSGANLSEEYFTNRLDRYMSFIDGGAGLVNFYADLCDILCKYAFKYKDEKHGSAKMSKIFVSDNDSVKKKELEQSLMELFSVEKIDSLDANKQTTSSTEPVAYAIPTLQVPRSFLGRQMQLYSDAEATRHLIQAALDHDTSLSVRLSSAYLNLTPNLLSILTKFGKDTAGSAEYNTNISGSVYILTAGKLSHGFAPKRQAATKESTGIVNKIKDGIPDAFLSLVKQVAKPIIEREGKILMYERAGWTFHAKGLWIAVDDNANPAQNEHIDDSSSLVSTVIGSGNYGARSEDLDVESNLILIFNDSTTTQIDSVSGVKGLAAAEWNEMCQHSTELVEIIPSSGTESKLMNVLLGFLKRFL